MNDINNILIILAAGIILGFIFSIWTSRALRKKRYVDVAQNAQFAEEEAEKLITRSGFKIIGRQKRAPIMTYINGKSHYSYVQADFIAEKGGRTYLIEVKTGGSADATDPIVRRQLLEYDYVFNPDGLILLNMEDRSFNYIDFDFPKTGSTFSFIKIVLGALIFSLLLGIIVILAQLRFF
jgi:hypothetical protein